MATYAKCRAAGHMLCDFNVIKDIYGWNAPFPVHWICFLSADSLGTTHIVRDITPPAWYPIPYVVYRVPLLQGTEESYFFFTDIIATVNHLKQISNES